MKKKIDIYKITGIILIIDQWIKLMINHSMKLYDEIKIIPGFFSILYVKNTGAAFSILEDNTIIIIVISIIFLYLLNDYIRKEQDFTKLSTLSLGMILGGILGNLIDRIIRHGVIDYLSFTFFKYNFPIFNFADMAITIGVFFLLLDMILQKKKGV